MGLNRRRFCAVMGYGVLGSKADLFAAEDALLHESSSRAFGTTVRLVTSHASRRIADAALKAALAEVSLIESLMSVHQPTSQISRLNRDKRLERPHPLLVEILRAASRYSRATNGAFDITVQPLWDLHKKMSERDQVPTERQLSRVRASIGHNNVEIHRDRILLHNHAEITLNGIAQGFATDRIKQILMDRGIEQALIDVGELAGIGEKVDGQSWTAGIQHPRHQDAFLSVTPIGDRCLATSGDYATIFSNDFQSHHIFDPNTGCSPTELASVSVLAPTTTQADALSTALLVMGSGQGAKLLAQTVGVDALFVSKAGHVLATVRFPHGRGS